jgi:hypothetical protein
VRHADCIRPEIFQVVVCTPARLKEVDYKVDEVNHDPGGSGIIAGSESRKSVRFSKITYL